MFLKLRAMTINVSMAQAAILKCDVCDVAMISTPIVVISHLHDLLYNQYIENTCCY